MDPFDELYISVSYFLLQDESDDFSLHLLFPDMDDQVDDHHQAVENVDHAVENVDQAVENIDHEVEDVHQTVENADHEVEDVHQVVGEIVDQVEIAGILDPVVDGVADQVVEELIDGTVQGIADSTTPLAISSISTLFLGMMNELDSLLFQSMAYERRHTPYRTVIDTTLFFSNYLNRMLRRPAFSNMSDDQRLQFQRSMIVNFLIQPLIKLSYITDPKERVQYAKFIASFFQDVFDDRTLQLLTMEQPVQYIDFPGTPHSAFLRQQWDNLYDEIGPLFETAEEEINTHDIQTMFGTEQGRRILGHVLVQIFNEDVLYVPSAQYAQGTIALYNLLRFGPPLPPNVEGPQRPRLTERVGEMSSDHLQILLSRSPSVASFPLSIRPLPVQTVLGLVTLFLIIFYARELNHFINLRERHLQSAYIVQESKLITDEYGQQRLHVFKYRRFSVPRPDGTFPAILTILFFGTLWSTNNMYKTYFASRERTLNEFRAPIQGELETYVEEIDTRYRQLLRTHLRHIRRSRNFFIGGTYINFMTSLFTEYEELLQGDRDTGGGVEEKKGSS